MKATINNSGKLRIIPENEIEEYALIKWYEEFRIITDSGSKSSIMVCGLEKKDTD